MGWEQVGPAEQWSPGVVREVPVTRPEGSVVVWCSGSGELAAVAARCPHQWELLASSGIVDGDDLVCAAHGWRFDTGGAGWKCNLAGRRDPKSPIATFGVRIVDGTVEVDVGD